MEVRRTAPSTGGTRVRRRFEVNRVMTGDRAVPESDPTRGGRPTDAAGRTQSIRGDAIRPAPNVGGRPGYAVAARRIFGAAAHGPIWSITHTESEASEAARPGLRWTDRRGGWSGSGGDAVHGEHHRCASAWSRSEHSWRIDADASRRRGRRDRYGRNREPLTTRPPSRLKHGSTRRQGWRGEAPDDPRRK